MHVFHLQTLHGVVAKEGKGAHSKAYRNSQGLPHIRKGAPSKFGKYHPHHLPTMMCSLLGEK